MGNKSNRDIQLRDSSLLTKIMLGQQDKVIDHIKQQNIDVNEPVNQMGDTLAHYASYKGQKVLLGYLFSQNANFKSRNSRGLTPLDLAAPMMREWMLKNCNMVK